VPSTSIGPPGNSAVRQLGQWAAWNWPASFSSGRRLTAPQPGQTTWTGIGALLNGATPRVADLAPEIGRSARRFKGRARPSAPTATIRRPRGAVVSRSG